MYGIENKDINVGKMIKKLRRGVSKDLPASLHLEGMGMRIRGVKRIPWRRKVCQEIPLNPWISTTQIPEKARISAGQYFLPLVFTVNKGVVEVEGDTWLWCHTQKSSWLFWTVLTTCRHKILSLNALKRAKKLSRFPNFQKFPSLIKDVQKHFSNE